MDIWQQIAQLQDNMMLAAKDLEFEEAARIRDKIHNLRLQAN